VVHTMHHHWFAWRALTKELGLEFSLEQLKAMAGKPTREILEILCAEQVRAAFLLA
jgi:hypothetical protein